MKHTVFIKTIFLVTLFAGLDSLHAQGPISDAVFVQIDSKLGKVVYHRVLENQTLYGISRGYGVSPAQIIEANHFTNPGGIKLPSVLKIPISDQQIQYRLPLFSNKKEYLPVYYQVQKKDNVFRISRVYFDIPTNLLLNRNNLRNENLQMGQTLHIGWIKSDFSPLKISEGKLKTESEENDSIINMDLAQKFRSEYDESLLINKNEVAYWKANENSKGFFIMHRYAPQQSIIEIKNPMSNLTVYAKVIGTIPAHLYPREVDMVISREVAQALGAVDPKFFVRSRYKPDRASASR